MSDLSAALMRLMRTAARMRTSLTSSAGCDFPALQVLGAIHARGPARATVLAEVLEQDASVVSRAIASLEQSGLARRDPDPHDGRAALVTLTDAGGALAAEHVARREALVAGATATWSAQDRDQFIRLLDRFVEGLGTHLGTPHASDTRESA